MTDTISITKQQARRFLLLKHGLLGEHQYHGKEGVYQFIKQFSCVQFDPIDVCGKNHELVLQSRIPAFKKEWVYELLYEERKLIDWFDKNMSILPFEDWVYFAEARQRSREKIRNLEEVNKVREEVLNFIKDKGPINSSDLDYTEKIDWWWAPTSFSRFVLEALYYQGHLIVENKKNTRKFYDLTENHIPKHNIENKQPFESEHERLKWNILRRLNSVGMLHLNASYAFIGIHGLKTKERNTIYKELLAQNIIQKLKVESIEKDFYFLKKDLCILEQVKHMREVPDRIEFIAPLDNLIWDRKIIEEIFDYYYKWEIYTPLKDRQYGYYVLPVLYKDQFIGRIELKRNRKEKRFDHLGLWFDDEAFDRPHINNLIQEHTRKFQKTML